MSYLRLNRRWRNVVSIGWVLVEPVTLAPHRWLNVGPRFKPESGQRGTSLIRQRSVMRWPHVTSMRWCVLGRACR